MQSLFALKDKVSPYTGVIYRVLVTKIILGRQFGMLKHDVMNMKTKNSKYEPAKHLKEKPNHKFTWTIISKASENFRKRRLLEAYFIKTVCPTLIEQLDNDILTLFRNGITYI